MGMKNSTCQWIEFSAPITGISQCLKQFDPCKGEGLSEEIALTNVTESQKYGRSIFRKMTDV